MTYVTREQEKSPEQTAYEVQAIKYQLSFGEHGQEVVRMVGQYIAEGWMDYAQAMMMLREVFNKETDD